MDFDTDNAFPRTKIGRDHQLRDQFRHGKVTDRKNDEKRGPLVRVQFLDKQGLVSYWLPVKQFGSHKTLHFYVPKIGENVNVNMLANGSEDGFVDGSFFTAGTPPPEGLDIDTRHFRAEDETVIEYREIDSTFNLADKNGPVLVKATHIDETADTYIQLHAGSYIEEHAGTYVEITAGTQVTITAPTIILNGHMIFNGLITHTGDMTTSGIHTDSRGLHGGVMRDAEIDELKERVRILEERLYAIETRGP
jgi:phage baseplate assembly protein V